MKSQAAAIVLAAVLTGCGHAPSVTAPVPHVAVAHHAAAPVVAAAKSAPVPAAASEVAPAARAVSPLVAVARAAKGTELAPGADFVRMVAIARDAVGTQKPTGFHLSGSVQQDRLLTAEIDGSFDKTGGTLVVTDSNVAEVKGASARWDAAAPLVLESSKGAIDLSKTKLAPFIAVAPLVSPEGLSEMLADAAAHVKGEEIVQRDGHAVAMFSFEGGAAASLKVGFPVDGGNSVVVEGPEQLSLVVSAR